MRRRFRWSLCCMFDIDVIVLVLFFYSVGLLFMIWITISVAAFRWVLYNVWCRFPPSAISQAFNSSWWRQVLKRRFTLYGFALLRDIETFAMLSQNPADPWKLSSISATSTGYQNKLDPTNQAIPFDIDVMLFPKVKCHDDVIMMIVDKVECHDVGWWPIFPGSSSIYISYQVKLMINYHGCVDTLQEECKKWFDKHARDGTNKTARARWIW